MTQHQRTFILALLLPLALLTGGAARADCTSPAGIEGTLDYDNANHVFRFCNGTSWVTMGGAGSGNTFAFHVKGAHSGTSAKVNFTTENVDVNNAFDIANDRFQPTAPGEYMFIATATGENCSGDAQLDLKKNTTTVTTGHSYAPSGGQYISANVNAVVSLNGSSDYVELHAWEDCTGTITEISFSGFKIGG
jgi:hypothetical protein